MRRANDRGTVSGSAPHRLEHAHGAATIKYILAIVAVLALTACTANATTESCAIVRKTPDGFLNLRYEPKISSVIVGRLKPGDQVLVHDETVPPQSQGKWARLAFGDYKFGYVRTRYLRLSACEGPR